MVWNAGKDELLFREILLFEPYQFKKRTNERGNAWRAIANNFNEITTHQFKVDWKAVRERFGHIIARFDLSSMADQKISGTAPEVTLLDQALQNISERMTEVEANIKVDSQSVKDKTNGEKQEAEIKRQTCSRNLGEEKESRISRRYKFKNSKGSS